MELKNSIKKYRQIKGNTRRIRLKIRC